MNLQVIYCNHQTASLGLRERLAFTGEEQLAAAYSQLRAQFPGSEAVVLSTCNRVEVYTAQNTEISVPTHDQLAEFLSDFHGVPLEEFLGDLLLQSGPAAVGHLCGGVSCGGRAGAAKGGRRWTGAEESGKSFGPRGRSRGISAESEVSY